MAGLNQLFIGDTGAGDDYDTVDEWEADTDGGGGATFDPVTDDDVIEGILRVDYSPFTVNNERIEGAGTDATRYRVLRPEDGEFYKPDDDSGCVIQTTISSNVIQFREQYSGMWGLGVDMLTEDSGNKNCIRLTGGSQGSNFFDRLVLRMTATSTTGNNRGLIEQSGGGGGIDIHNCIAIGSGGSNGMRTGFSCQDVDPRMRHCAAYAIDQGANSCYGIQHITTANSTIIRESISMDCRTADYDWTPAATGGVARENMASDTSAPASPSQTKYNSESSSNIWVDAANDDFHLLHDGSNNAINNGTGILAAFPTDIDGVAHNNDSKGFEIGPYNEDTVVELECSMDADATLDADARIANLCAATFSANATLTADLRIANLLACSMDADATLSPDLRIANLLAASMDADASLTVDLRIANLLAATFAAEAALTPTLNQIHALACNIAAESRLFARMGQPGGGRYGVPVLQASQAGAEAAQAAGGTVLQAQAASGEAVSAAVASSRVQTAQESSGAAIVAQSASGGVLASQASGGEVLEAAPAGPEVLFAQASEAGVEEAEAALSGVLVAQGAGGTVESAQASVP